MGSWRAAPVQTFEEADLAKDGRISHEEWLILVQKHPVIINYMTLPVLREVGPARSPYASSPGDVRPCPLCKRHAVLPLHH